MAGNSVTDRQRGILDRLQAGSSRSYAELAEEWQVSSMTIRRDVERLARSGKVVKTLGGVYRPRDAEQLYETSLLSRLAECVDEKQAIARAALRLAADRETVYLDGGTTCIHLARELARADVALRVVTCSAMICLELAKSDSIRVTGLGGDFDPNSLCFYGADCEDAARRYYVDEAFLSTKGFVPADGTYESFEGTARTKQVVAGQCGRAVLLIDHTKFGRRALRRVLETSQVDLIVTDAGVSDTHVEASERNGCAVAVAPHCGKGIEVS